VAIIVNNNEINKIHYKNSKRGLDFEIVDLRVFMSTRPHTLLSKDYRLTFWAILYIVEGEGHHSIDFIEYPYKAGDIIFIQKNQVHHFVVNESAKGYVIHINDPFFYEMKGVNSEIFHEFADASFGSPILTVDISGECTNRRLIDLIYKEYQQQSEKFNAQLIATLFQGFILSLHGQAQRDLKGKMSNDYEHFKEFRQLVEENYTTIKTVEEYALKMNLTKKTINCATRSIIDSSAKQFIIDRIILEIKRYLTQGELMNYEIATLLGFDEAANMTRFFKRYVGMSPKSFRESL